MAAPTPLPGSEGQNLAIGLYKLLSPIVEECDARIQDVMDSQANLSKQIETLAADLDYFMTFTQTPPLAAHLQRLLNARNRLVTINTTLLTIMGRLDRIAAGVDPQVKERKVSLGSIFSLSSSKGVPPSPQKAAPLLSQPTLDPSLSLQSQPQQPPQQPTPQEQPPTQPQENKSDTTNEKQETESNDQKSETQTTESLP